LYIGASVESTQNGCRSIFDYTFVIISGIGDDLAPPVERGRGGMIGDIAPGPGRGLLGIAKDHAPGKALVL